MNDYYNQRLKGDKGALKRALYKACGFTDEDLQKPVIGIADSWSDANPGHAGMNRVAERLQDGIRDAGGTAMTLR